MKQELIHAATLCKAYDREHNVKKAMAWGHALIAIMNALWLDTKGTEVERMDQMRDTVAEVESETGYHIIWP